MREVKAQALMSVLANTSTVQSAVGVPQISLVAVPNDPAERTWAARDLLRSLAVPRILAGAGRDAVQRVIELEQFGESEPLLLASAALANSWLDIAESAHARGTLELLQAHQPEAVELLSLALLDMAMCRQRGDAVAGLAHASRLKNIASHLTISERAQTPELSPLIDYYVAGFELSRGYLDRARWTLERGAGPLRQRLDIDCSSAELLVRANCAGKLSWIDAFCGDQRRATRYATSLIKDWPIHGGETGLCFGHLALALTHLERSEFEQARGRLDHVLGSTAGNTDPLLLAAQQLTQLRLAIATDEPETALRLLAHIEADHRTSIGWFASQFSIARAEAYLAAGEPQQAIATLHPEPELAAVEARLLLARAFRLACDPRAAEDTMTRVPSDPVAISLVTRVHSMLLEAQFAAEKGNRERAKLLVDRALRTAEREQLRTTVGSAGPWLRSFVARESELSRRHSGFLTSVIDSGESASHYEPVDPDAYATIFVVPLTARETDVLRLLGEFCSNEEIAADLVLSLNTVKTHMRSLFQKLSVTRRADAVRRGRALGLC
jgi:LuxR family transcriptional regulator, maltose regulon positive regulatory protein